MESDDDDDDAETFLGMLVDDLIVDAIFVLILIGVGVIVYDLVCAL